MRKIVYDIETSNLFHEVGERDPAALDLAVVGVYDSETDDYKCYKQEDLKDLWPILEKADMMIGFNSDHFDLPLLNKYYPGDLTQIKSLDLMKEIKNSLGRRIGLGTIAEATLGIGKSADGLIAVKWWRQGKIKEVCDYCIQDVKVTKEVYDYALKNGHLKYKDGETLRQIPIKTDHWEKKEESAMTASLGF